MNASSRREDLDPGRAYAWVKVGPVATKSRKLRIQLESTSPNQNKRTATSPRHTYHNRD